MSRRDEAGDTFRSVEGRYDRWSESNPQPRGRSALKVPVMSDAAEKMVGMAVGFGAGALLLVLAVVAGVAARSWAEVDRSGAVVGYAVTAFFLALAGLGAVVATWNHAFRVIPGEAPHHH
jgi:hypothetical protein